MSPRKRLLLLLPIAITAVVTLWPTEAAAQRRRGPARTVIVGARYGYSPFFYPYYYNPYWFGFGYGLGWYDYQFRPYPPYGPYGPYRGYYDTSADLRIQVTPRDAEVYVDGYLAGRVDDFDGVFQRLRMPLGEHEITIYMNGYRTIREKMFFRPFETYHIKQPMQQLGAGESPEPRPVPAEPAAGPRGRDTVPYGPEPRQPRQPREPRAPREPREPAQPRADRFGQISVRVQPADASVFIDDERWEAPAGESRLLVETSEGTHRIEIRKDGFKPYSSTVRVRAGETVTVNVSLPPQ